MTSETIGTITSAQIDDYVAECDSRFGGIQNEAWLHYVSDFELIYDTEVDLTADPFSDIYFRQQLALHRELSGRDINQAETELAPIDIGVNASGPNPYSSNDIQAMSRHAGTIAIAMCLAAPPPGAAILDLGVGTGMSSEQLAYFGGRVTAVDINPSFVNLVGQRAARFGYPIEPLISNFDDVSKIAGSFDMAFFFASLHHGTRTWDILEDVANLLKPGGKIVLAGEPIQTLWWPYWGLRLDPESVYVTRKYGWFESGWSEIFLRKMFERIGFRAEVTYVDQRFIEGQAIAVAERADGPQEVTELQAPVIERGQLLTFGAGGDGLQYLTFGWSAAADPASIWSSGTHSGFLLSLPEGSSWTLSFEVGLMVSESHPLQEVKVSMNGRALGLFNLGGTPGSFTGAELPLFTVSFAREDIGLASDASLVDLRFSYPSATKAQWIGRGNDPRRLAVALASLKLE